MKFGSDTTGVSNTLRRITRFQYRLAVQDLFASDVDLDLGVDFPADDTRSGYEAGGFMSGLHAVAYQLAAENIAAQVVGRVPKLASCAPIEVGTALCAERFIVVYGARAFRRLLKKGEIAGLLVLYSIALNNKAGLLNVIEAILESPYFLYRVSGTALSIAMADRLAFFIWNSLPDRELLSEAEAGRLGTPAQVLTQAKRMLDDPKARRGFRDFYRQWLKLAPATTLYRDPGLYPQFSAELATEIDASFDAFFDHVLWEGTGELGTLLTTDEVFANKVLAPVFGLEMSQDSLLLGHTDRSKRLGLITQPLFLANYATPAEASPIQRGASILRQLICHPLAPPPQNLPITDFGTGSTLRQKVEAATADKTCQACHRNINPIGFALGHFDAIGAFQDFDNGIPIDASGNYTTPSGETFAFNGAPQFATALAQSDQAKRCFISQLFRYAMGRFETKADQDDLADLHQRFVGSNGNIRDLLLGMTQTRAFLSPSAGPK
jgi:hypothetical protein